MRMLSLVLIVLGSVSFGAQQQSVTASNGWMQAPAAGDTTALAFVTIQNPTMYDVYVVSATAEIAGSVEFRNTSQAGANKPLSAINVPAYGSIEMKPDAVHLVLRDLKKRPTAGDTVTLTLTTDGNVTLKVSAAVKE